MVTIVGQVFEPSGLPTTTPFKVWLVSYGTDPQSHRLYVSPSPQVVTPDPITGQFEFDVWANVTADIPCYYRVQFDFGLQLKLLVPASDSPLQFTDLIVDDTIELLPGILNRVAKLEDTGGVVIPTQNFSVGGWLTSPPVAYDGTAPVVIPVDSINSQGLTGVIPKPLLSGSYNISLDNALSFGQGLSATSGSYSGGSANTVSVDATIARRSDVAMTDPREWVAATVSQTEAEAGTGIGRRAWTPERVWQAITAWVAQYLPSATLEQAELGTGTTNLSWSPSKITALVSAYTSSNGVTSVAGKVGDVSLVPADIVGLGDITDASNLLTGVVDSALVPLAQTATRLATGRTINGVTFDGTANIVVPTPSSLTFGTGLVAGSFNGSSATTLAVDTGVVVQQSDSRLTDAREWIASTVTQSEAETGTATTRRAWTAQRVTQAVAAWWASSANKVKLDSIATGAQVNTVTSVAAKTGAVTLVPGDVGLGNVPNVNATIASNITSGTLPDARLSGNVAMLNGTQRTFTGVVGVGMGAGVASYDGNNPIAGLVGGTTSGLLLESSTNGHIVGYLKANDVVDSFSLVRSNYTTDSASRVPEALIFRVRASGDIESFSTTNATSPTSTASFKTSGGIACAGDIYANGGKVAVQSSGTWTPSLGTTTNVTEPAYTTKSGYWQVSGNLCYIRATIVISGTMPFPGDIRIRGLPFPINSTVNTSWLSVTLGSNLSVNGVVSFKVFSTFMDGFIDGSSRLSTSNVLANATFDFNGVYPI